MNFIYILKTPKQYGIKGIQLDSCITVYIPTVAQRHTYQHCDATNTRRTKSNEVSEFDALG